MTVISFSTGVLRQKLKDNEKLGRRVEAIQQASQHAADLTSQLLAFSRKQESRPQVINLNSIVQQTQKMFGRLLGEDIKVVLELEKEPWNVQIDPTQVGQILMNLATNARDAMPDGGTFCMKTANWLEDQQQDQHGDPGPGEFARLIVTDTGCGMDEATLQRVFEPFFTTKEIGKGTGLGLSTVFGIVKQAGGSIKIRSKPKEGTVFEIDLPHFVADEESTPTEKAEKNAPSNPCSETVLVVEDEDSIRNVVCEALRSEGYQVLEAPDGPTALALAQVHRDPIDLLLTDVVMPNMSGAALARELLSRRPGVKVLYLTGYSDEVVSRNGVDLRRSKLIQKPFGDPTLGRSVRDVLDASA